MIYKIFPILLLLVASVFSGSEHSKTIKKEVVEAPKETLANTFESLYNHLNIDANQEMPAKESFFKALDGYYKMKSKGLIQKDIITLVDFSLSSNAKRLWVIDLAKNKILYNSLVAHGKNSGEEFANTFSNVVESNMSSLGFYATGEVYQGKHGLSLKLDGLQKGLNDQARNRAVVIHGADYVNENFIKNHNRLGRSQGCPAIPKELTKGIIETIKGKSCLFIYHPSKEKSFSTFLS